MNGNETQAMSRAGDERRNEVSTQAMAGIIDQLMRPLIESIGTLLKHNTEAMEQIATSQDVIRNRMEALEKQVRLQTPVTEKQARYLGEAAKSRAKELLDKKGAAEDRKAVAKLTRAIRKSVLMRYGYGSFQEIPKVEYSVAMDMIATWNSVMEVMEAAREARERKEAEMANEG